MIGDFLFIALHGHPGLPKEQPQVVARGGVDGVGIWRTGVRGAPFQMISQVDMPSLNAAKTLFAAYAGWIAQDPVVLIQDDYDYSAQGWQVVVLDVELRQCHALVTSDGGINPPSLAYLEVAWTLQAVFAE